MLIAVLVSTGCSSSGGTDIICQPTKATQTIQSLKERENDFPSDEQLTQWQEDSFRPIIEKWLKGEQMPQHVELIRNDEYASNSERGASIELLDVNGDGIKELAMLTGCATVGNCVFFVFQKTSEGYQQILSADMVQSFKLKRVRSKSYFDIETSAHSSSTTGNIAVYKFDGQEYKIAECASYEYRSTGKFESNKQRFLNASPTITPKKCENSSEF